MSERQLLKKEIEKFIIDNNINIRGRLPHGYRHILGDRFNISSYFLGGILRQIRDERGLNMKHEIIKSSETGLQQYCLDNKLYRNSNKETSACDKIIQSLKKIVPQGGRGMIIGTPTPFCACNFETNNGIITDNLEVAAILKFTTDQPITIIVGDAVNPEKATLKGQHWKSNSITKDARVHVRKVDSFWYNHLVNVFAAGGGLCKVILLTSGVWNDSTTSQRKRKKQGINLDLNFATPSFSLSKIFPKLHILALYRESKYNFGVKYLHNGERYNITWTK